MDDESPGMRLVREEAAKGGDVVAAVNLVLEKALVELDEAIAESERELAEADVLFEEAEDDTRVFEAAEGDTWVRNREVEDGPESESLNS
jgi:hypothetical protein